MADNIQVTLHTPTKEEEMVIKKAIKMRMINPGISVLVLWLISFIMTIIHVNIYVKKYGHPVNMFYVTIIYILMLFVYICITGNDLFTFYLSKPKVFYTYCNDKKKKMSYNRYCQRYTDFYCLSIQENDAIKYNVKSNYVVPTLDFHLAEIDYMVMIVCWRFLFFNHSELLSIPLDIKLTDRVRAENKYGPNKKSDVFIFWKSVKRGFESIIFFMLFIWVIIQFKFIPVEQYEITKVIEQKKIIYNSIDEQIIKKYKREAVIITDYPQGSYIDDLVLYGFCTNFGNLDLWKGYTDRSGNIYKDDIAYMFYTENLDKKIRKELDLYFYNYDLIFNYSGYIPYEKSDCFEDYYNILLSEPENVTINIYVNEESQQNIADATEHLNNCNILFQLNFYTATDKMINTMKKYDFEYHAFKTENTNITALERNMEIDFDKYNLMHEINY